MALYFAFVSFYARALGPLSAIGIIFWLGSKGESDMSYRAVRLDALIHPMSLLQVSSERLPLLSASRPGHTPVACRKLDTAGPGAGPTLLPSESGESL